MNKKCFLILLIFVCIQSHAVFFDPTCPPKVIDTAEQTKTLPFKLVMILCKKKAGPYAHFSIGDKLKKVQEGDYLEGFNILKIDSHSVTIKDDEGTTQIVKMNEINEESTIIKHKIKEPKKAKDKVKIKVKKSLKKKKISKPSKMETYV